MVARMATKQHNKLRNTKDSTNNRRTFHTIKKEQTILTRIRIDQTMLTQTFNAKRSNTPGLQIIVYLGFNTKQSSMYIAVIF